MPIAKHLSRSFFAGLIALLPIGGSLLAVFWMESMIASSWLTQQRIYFPGLGLILVAIAIYLIGVCVTTWIGRFLWARIDRCLDRVPAIGEFYRTLKQILGYGKGEDALFRYVVLVEHRETGAEELGLVTNSVADRDGRDKLLVFLPTAPSPTNGRLLLIDPKSVRKIDLSVHDALKSLLSVGKTPPIGA